jgi:hypothetical protein
MKSLRLPLVLFVAALPLVGCTSGATGNGRERSDAAEPVVTTIPTVLSTDNLSLPIERYLLSPDQIRILDRARLDLIDQCMTRFGFRYVVKLPDLVGRQNLTDRRYGVTDARFAATNGYGLGAGDPSHQVRPREPRLTPVARTVLFGRGQSTVKGVRVPSEGCLGEANAVLAQSAPPGAKPELGQKLSLASFEKSQQDSRVRRAFGAWSGCMAASGYHYTDPLQPAADPELEAASVAVGAKVAGLDIACKKRTNLVGIWYAVESAYLNRMIKENQPALDVTKRSFDAQLRAASSAQAARRP